MRYTCFVIACTLLSTLPARATTINFDVDSNGNPVSTQTIFVRVTRLTNLYSPLGVTFSGPGGNDGGLF